MAKSKKKKKTIKNTRKTTKKNITKKKKRKISNQKKKNYNTKTKSNKAKSTSKTKTKKTTTEKKKTTSTKKDKKTVVKEKQVKKEINKTEIKSKNYKNIIFIIIFILLFGCFFYLGFYNSPTLTITNKYIDDNNNLVVEYKKSNYSIRNNVYCYYSLEDTIDVNAKWEKSNNNKCSIVLNDKPYYIYLKNEDNKIFKAEGTNNLGKVLSLKLDKEKIYLPLKGTYDIKATYESIGTINEEISYTSNDDILSIESNKITGLKKGSTKVLVKLLDKEASLEVIVTDLITTRPKNGYDYKKGYLPCNKYSEEENNLVDEILKFKINEAGYKTRASVVEAARFLTLDFPYRINYFYENGRQTTNNVDGEGRYYHEGLYLNKSRNKNITGSSKGPIIWGCGLYCTPGKRYMDNGLDCSGFVSWALLNGGFDVKDVGAGWSDNSDLTDFGDVEKLTTSLSTSNRIKVGDLLHSEAAGGHIGIIIGKDNEYYYVAQALWYDEIGVIISKYKKEKLSSTFPHVVLMDKYYKEDGKLTNMWK